MLSRPRAAATLLALAGLVLGGPVAVAAAAEPVPVTPAAPVVDTHTCGVADDTITLPVTEGVEYSIALDRDRLILPEGVAVPGSLVIVLAMGPPDNEVLSDADLPDVPTHGTVTVEAHAEDGFVLTADAPTSFTVTIDNTPCETGGIPGITVTSEACEQVTFTNPAENPDAYLLLPQGGYEIAVPAGSTRRLPVDPGTYSWYSIDAAIVAELVDDADLAVGQVSPAQRALRAEPDGEVMSEADLKALAVYGEMFDAMTALDSSSAEVTVVACQDDDGPQVPAVVQTDGGPAAVAGHSPFGLLVLGGLLAGTSMVLRRVTARL